jgi:hypothetical protein
LADAETAEGDDVQGHMAARADAEASEDDVAGHVYVQTPSGPEA